MSKGPNPKAAKEPVVRLRSNDGHVFKVNLKVTRLMKTISGIEDLANCGAFETSSSADTDEDIMTVAPANSHILRQVIRWCQFHHSRTLPQVQTSDDIQDDDDEDYDDSSFSCDHSTDDSEGSDDRDDSNDDDDGDNDGVVAEKKRKLDDDAGGGPAQDPGLEPPAPREEDVAMSEEAGEDEDASPEEMEDGKNDGPSTSRGSRNSGPGEAVDPVASSGRKRHQDCTAGKGNANLGAGGNQGDAAVKVEEEEVEEEQEEVEEEGAEAAGREQEGEEVYFDESEFKDGKAEQFNDAFFSVDNLTFFYLLKTANFLDIPSMVNVGCKRLARKLTGKTLLGMIEAMKIQDHERPARAERQEDTGTGQH